MTPEHIIDALKSGRPPGPMLTAGVAQAEAIAPRIYDIATRFTDGIYLLPGDQNALVHGLHVLAAARHRGLCDCVLSIIRQPADDFNRLFPAPIDPSVVRMLLSVWDRDTAFLLNLIEHGDLTGHSRGKLYDLLARLTFDGRIPRADTVAFLTRVERDGLIDEDDDEAWRGWELAVTRLGLTELQPALDRVRTHFAELQTEIETEAASKTISRAAADPSDPTPFEGDGITPIDDPAESVDWIAKRLDAVMAKLAEMMAAETGDASDDTSHDFDMDFADEDDDAARDPLTLEELDWLEGFLVSRQVPSTTMTLEMLDGFFTALVIGPELVMPSTYLKAVWGTEDGEGPVWDGMEQLQFFMGLITRHWNAIADRRNAKADHTPLIENYDDGETGKEWGEGFMTGIELTDEAWMPIFTDRRAQSFLMPVVALAGDLPEELAETFTPEMREPTVENLPDLLRQIANYWMKPRSTIPQFTPSTEPLRSTKVGRNDPCPCGSGKKYKKCCGSGSQTIN